MKFNVDSMAFGRHETFALRYGWLSKGFNAIRNSKKGAKVFEDDDATVILGVGKNMVTSIKYWLRACGMTDAVTGEPTELGIALLSEDGFDPFLEDEATVWLLHWLLVTNTGLATSWYWFFNRYHKTEFNGQELSSALTDFVNDQVIGKKKPAATTLKNDANLVTRMYTQSKGNTRTPIEDALDSPFALLKLVTQSSGGRSFQSRLQARPELPVGVLGFAVCALLNAKSAVVIPIEDLMYSRDDYPSPGSVFRMSESSLVAKLEELVDYIPGIFEVRDTAGQHQLYMSKKIDCIDFIKKHYKQSQEEKAA